MTMHAAIDDETTDLAGSQDELPDTDLLDSDVDGSDLDDADVDDGDSDAAIGSDGEYDLDHDEGSCDAVHACELSHLIANAVQDGISDSATHVVDDTPYVKITPIYGKILTVTVRCDDAY